MRFMMTDDQMWQAVMARDNGAVGDFVYAVETTGIYCRPSCSSRRPRRQNVHFFPLPEVARQAGFRACKRCLPDTAPASDPELARIREICSFIEARLEDGLDGPPNFEKTHWVLRADRGPAELATALGRPLAKVEAALREIRSRLRSAREQRVPPLRDDKQIIGWNGLMISAFARAGLALREPAFVESAAAAARALLSRGRPDGRLARYLKDGRPHGVGLLEDHAFLVAGLLDLFEADGQPRWLDAALAVQREQDLDDVVVRGTIRLAEGCVEGGLSGVGQWIVRVRALFD